MYIKSQAAFIGQAPPRNSNFGLQHNDLIHAQRKNKNGTLLPRSFAAISQSTLLAMEPPTSYNTASEITAVASINGQIIVPNETADVLSTQDIAIGTILAFVLAFGYSFLNGQSSSSSFISWPAQTTRIINNDLSENDSLSDIPLIPETDNDNKVFDEENWKEISREENYILYNTKIREKTNAAKKNSESIPRLQNVNKKENKLVLVALLVLFVPIFSVEFFFALSRQFMCEMGMGGDFVEKLCSPIRV